MNKLKELFEALLKALPESAELDREEVMANFDEALAETQKGGGNEALQKANQDMLKEIKTLKQRLRQGQGEDSARVSELEDKIEELKADYETKLRSVTSERDAFASKYTKETKKLSDSLALIQQAHSKAAIDREISEALVKGNVKKEDFELLKKFFRADNPQVLVEGEGTKVLLGNKPIAEHISEYLASDDGKRRVQAPQSSGGGAPGSGSGTGAGNQMSRAEFEKLPAAQQMEFATKPGNTIV